MKLKRIGKGDREPYLSLVKEFYMSEAVLHPVDESHFEAAFDELMHSDARIVCYMVEEQGETAGYILLAKFFSQEAGGEVIWFDEIYIKKDFRGKGIGSAAMRSVFEEFPDAAAFRLEIEPDNIGAKRLYEHLGFENLGYKQMILNCKK